MPRSHYPLWIHTTNPTFLRQPRLQQARIQGNCFVSNACAGIFIGCDLTARAAEASSEFAIPSESVDSGRQRRAIVRRDEDSIDSLARDFPANRIVGSDQSSAAGCGFLQALR